MLPCTGPWVPADSCALLNTTHDGSTVRRVVHQSTVNINNLYLTGSFRLLMINHLTVISSQFLCFMVRYQLAITKKSKKCQGHCDSISLIIYAQNPLDTFPRNFPVDGEVTNLLATSRCNGIWETTRHNRPNGLLPATTCYRLVTDLSFMLRNYGLATGKLV